MARMTPEKFMTKLSKMRVGWYLSRGNKIRSREGFSCPITAVCSQVTGKFHRIGLWRKAAVSLGLGWLFSFKVMLAADNAFLHSKKLRQKLLVATGITNPN